MDKSKNSGSHDEPTTIVKDEIIIENVTKLKGGFAVLKTSDGMHRLCIGKVMVKESESEEEANQWVAEDEESKLTTEDYVKIAAMVIDIINS